MAKSLSSTNILRRWGMYMIVLFIPIKPETDDKFETITGLKSVEVLSTNTTVVSPLSGTKYKNSIHYITAKFITTNSGSIRIYPSDLV